jgi:hypothetical protein
MKTLLICFFSGFVLFQVKAQENAPDLVTDRPDQTESSIVVPLRSLQIESGFVYALDENPLARAKNISYNTTLMRYGLLENMEMRLGIEYAGEEVTDQSTGKKTSSYGFSPLYTGLKLQITHEKGFMPEIAFLAGLELPFTAHKTFKTSHTAANMRFSLSHTLSERFSLGYNLGAEWDGDTPVPSYFYSVALGLSITGKAGAFIEFYGLIPEKGISTHLIDGGITFLIKQNLQLDASGGLGLNKEAVDYFISFGISYRLPLQ